MLLVGLTGKCDVKVVTSFYTCSNKYYDFDQREKIAELDGTTNFFHSARVAYTTETQAHETFSTDENSWEETFDPRQKKISMFMFKSLYTHLLLLLGGRGTARIPTTKTG